MGGGGGQKKGEEGEGIVVLSKYSLGQEFHFRTMWKEIPTTAAVGAILEMCKRKLTWSE